MLDLAIWLARTVVTSVVPPILIPLNAAFFNATVGSSPFHMLMAKDYGGAYPEGREGDDGSELRVIDDGVQVPGFGDVLRLLVGEVSRLHYLLGLLRIRDSFDLPVFDFAGHRLARIFDGVGGTSMTMGFPLLSK